MKQVRNHVLDIWIVLIASLALAWSPGPAQASQTVINVATVAELEAAVLVPAAIVKVAPGTYALTQNLILADGTKLVGSNKMRDTDRDGIPDPIEPPDGFVVAGTETKIVGNPAITGGIIRGSGSNRVSQITVEGPVGARTLVENVREVVDCLLDGTPGAAGQNDQCMLVANSECSACQIDVIVRRNVARDCVAGANFSNSRTTDARIKLLMSGNRFYRNVSGVVTTGGLAAATSEVDVVSIRNLMEGNFQGWAATGGTGIHHQVPGVLTGGQGNRVKLYSFADAFRDNTLWGFLGQAAFRRLVPVLGYSGENSDNRVQVSFLAPVFDQDPAPPAPGGLPRGDVALLGGFSSPSAAPPSPGTNNVVEVLALGSEVEPDATADLLLIQSNPEGTGNAVVILGSESSFAFLNDPFDIETFGVDVCEFFSAGCPE